MFSIHIKTNKSQHRLFDEYVEALSVSCETYWLIVAILEQICTGNYFGRTILCQAQTSKYRPKLDTSIISDHLHFL